VAQLEEVMRYKPGDEVSIFDGVNEIFHWFNPSGRNTALLIVLKSVTSWNPKSRSKPV
jgi:16S rRNA U1498 N3-methylase RsmE